MSKKQKNKSPDFNQVKKVFLNVLSEASSLYGREIHEVPPIEFWSVCNGRLSEWDLRKLGGFSKLKQILAPYRPSQEEMSEAIQKGEESKDKRAAKNAVLNGIRLTDFEKFAEKVFKGRVRGSSYRPKKGKKQKTTRILNAVISDIHIGSDVRKAETGVLNYGKKEEARRLAAVVQQIAEYKREHRDSTELELVLLGDLIQGQLHDARDGAPAAEQWCRCVHLLSQAIGYLATQFKVVRVRCNTGNHGRTKSRHMERATHQKWDSEEFKIFYALKVALAQMKNVQFYMPLTPYGIYENFGAKILYTHGDTVIKPGYPGNSINVKGLEMQINKINASLPDKDEIKVVIVGHVHIGSYTELPNGTAILTNGALVPVDEYSVSLGSLESSAGQFMFESVEGYPVGDIRYIRVNRSTDQDETLEKIIAPWVSDEEKAS